MLTELHENATPNDAERWLRTLVREFGLGFHPDTPPADYVNAAGEPLDEETVHILTVSLERLFSILGDIAPYDICFDEAWHILNSPRR